MRVVSNPNVGVVGAAAVKPDRTPPAAAASLKIAQFNVENFFDTVDDPKGDPGRIGDQIPTAEEYRTKLSKLAIAISGQMGAPDIISLNEVENERVLTDLMALPAMKDLGYKSVIRTLNDRRGIRVAMLYRESKVDVVNVSEFNPDMKFPDSATGQVDPGKLYARAPLIVDFRLHGAAQAADGAGLLTIITNHFKSKLGGSKPEPRRQAQGEQLGAWVDARRAQQPHVPVMVVGDLNATYDDGAYKKLASRADGTQRLYDVPLKMADADRYTYIYRGHRDMLDHMMVTPELQDALIGARIPHFNSGAADKKQVGDATVANGVSDHDPIIAEFDVRKLFGAGAAARAGVAALG